MTETMSKVRSAQLDMLEKQARAMFRTVGPRAPGEDPAMDRAAIRHCSRCSPEPAVHECPICNWQTYERWQWRLHVELNPKWCGELGAKRAQAWGRNA